MIITFQKRKQILMTGFIIGRSNFGNNFGFLETHFLRPIMKSKYFST